MFKLISRDRDDGVIVSFNKEETVVAKGDYGTNFSIEVPDNHGIGYLGYIYSVVDGKVECAKVQVNDFEVIKMG